MVITGSTSFVVYDKSGTWKTFGLGTRVTSVSVRNNFERIPVLGQRNAAALVPLRYEGSWSIETYTTTTTTISGLAADWGWEDEVTTPVQNNIYIGLGGVGTAAIAERYLVNAMTNRVSITAREGEIVRLSIDGIFQKEGTFTAPTTVTKESGTPLTFANGIVVIDGNEVALVQSIDMTINVNPNPIYALRSRYFQDVYLRMLEADGRMTVVATNKDWIDIVNDLTSYGEVVLRFVDDPSSSSTVYDEIALVGVQVNELTHSVEPNELVVYDVSFIAKGVRFGTT